MKSNLIAFVGVSVLVGFVLLIALVVVRPALAQVDTTSTEPVVASSSPVETIEPVSASTTQEGTGEAALIAPAGETSSEPAPSETQEVEASQPQTLSQVETTEAVPEGLTKVRIIGTKYTDYFTDGTETFAFPGDPAIGARLGEKDAPIPTREGLTWVHTTGSHLYDTPSGDLEMGQYAVQPNGQNVVNPIPFVSSTSSPPTIETDNATSS